MIPWDTGTQYITRSRVSDLANNSEMLSAPVKFGVDMDIPISDITYPANNTFLNSLDTISGSAQEYGHSGITSVEIRIIRNIDNRSWQGTTWEMGKYWHITLGTYLWSYDSSNITWTNDHNYTIQSHAIDLAENIQEPYSENTFMYDVSPPHTSILINDDAKYTNSTNVILSLEALDSGSGVDTIELSFDGTSWLSGDSFNNTQSHELFGSDGEKTVYLKVTDLAGNVAEPVFDTIILDTTPPEYLSIAINNDNEYTNNRQALLNLNASDLLSGIKDVSYFIGDDWTPWDPFKQERSISLPPGEGKKNIVYRVRDNAGNIAQISSSIVLDTIPPFSLKISIIENVSAQDSTSITLKLTAYDNTSGLSQMAFSLDGVNWSTWEAFSNTKVYELSAESRSKFIYFRVNDRAGNIAKSVSIDIPIKEEPTPSKAKTTSTLDLWNILFIIIIFIIILALTVFILKRKKPEKKKETQESPPTEAITVKPNGSFSSISEKSSGILPVDNKTEQLPANITMNSDEAKLPELPATATTVPGQIPEPQQIPEAPEKPQLPPSIETTKTEADDESMKWKEEN